MISLLRIFNALVPVDAGVLRSVIGLAYGAHPRQRLDVYKSAAATAPLPVIIFCYGGAWSWGERGSYEFVGRSLAAQGFVVILFDYRLVPETRYPGFVEDTAAVIAWAATHAGELGGDASRLFLVGHSAGAYNVAQAVLDQSFLAAHGFDSKVITGVATLAGPFDFLPLDDPSTVAAFDHWPDPQATQPVNHVTANSPPFLLLTGAEDGTVYPRNSESLSRRLGAESVPHRLIAYPGIGHAAIMLALSRPLRWRAPVLADMMAFFEELQAAPRSSAITP